MTLLQAVLHFFFPETSIQRGNAFNTVKSRGGSKANTVWKVKGFNKFKRLWFSGLSCYLNRKLHCFTQIAHLQMLSLLSLCF